MIIFSGDANRIDAHRVEPGWPLERIGLAVADIFGWSVSVGGRRVGRTASRARATQLLQLHLSH